MLIGLIEQSFATGNVAGSGNTFGGFAGSSIAVIRNTFATGSVQGAVTSGGFVGSVLNNARIENSYNLSNNPSGFDGTVATAAVIANSFFEIGMLDENIQIIMADHPHAKTIEQLIQLHEFADWDLYNVCEIQDMMYTMLRGLPRPQINLP